MKGERYFGSRLAWQQYFEQRELQAKHINERRERARQEHRLVTTPEEFKTDMIWEQQRVFPGYLAVYGYTLEDIDNERPSKSGFWCGDCAGWVSGAPVIREYNNITFLAGSRGEKYDCGICGHTIADAVFEQS